MIAFNVEINVACDDDDDDDESWIVFDYVETDVFTVTRLAMLAAVTVHTVVFNVHLAPTILYLYL